MEYIIDAELLRKEIEKNKNMIGGLFTEGDDSVYDGEDYAYNIVLRIIDSLQQEQPEVDIRSELEKYIFPISVETMKKEPFTQLEKCAHYFYELGIIDSHRQGQPESSKGKFVFPNFLYARTIDNKTIDVSYAPQNLDAVEYIKNDPTEQPEVDLEKEIDAIWNPRFNLGWDEKSLLSINHSAFETIARHFYELGINARKEG